MARPGELAFYAGRSGLPSGASLTRHKLAYYESKGYTTGSLRQREYDFFLAQTGKTRATTSYDQARFAYFDANVATNVAGSGSIDALMIAFFANPPAP